MTDQTSATPETGRFEISVDVTPDDIDELGHVNNVVYLRWVQDVAAAHWKAKATDTLQATVAWVALRHEIDYKHAALPGDRVIASTWVGPAESVRFERFVEILRAGDRKVLARSRSLWAPVSRATGRVTRASDDLRALFSKAYEAQG
ncbi:MAG: thioesterase family protein [Gemmatimonadaceae bacterium]